ncbi:hypothetical protein STEG23_035253 [Scotinomys teguina]
MSRCQCKNTGNNIKTYMTPLEPSDSTPARPEHTNAEAAEEINPKNDFKKMIEALKEEMKGLEGQPILDKGPILGNVDMFGSESGRGLPYYKNQLLSADGSFQYNGHKIGLSLHSRKWAITFEHSDTNS